MKLVESILKKSYFHNLVLFSQIREVTGEDDIDYLVRHFISVEDKNFALFNYVNEQNDEIEGLQEKIADVSKQTNK